MTLLLIISYSVIGLISYISFIKWCKAKGDYIDWDDIVNGFIAFGVLWIMCVPLFLFAPTGLGLGDKILDWVNKK